MQKLKFFLLSVLLFTFVVACADDSEDSTSSDNSNGGSTNRVNVIDEAFLQFIGGKTATALGGAHGGSLNFTWSDNGTVLSGDVMGVAINHTFVEADNITGAVYFGTTSAGGSHGAVEDNNTLHIWDNLTGGWYISSGLSFNFVISAGVDIVDESFLQFVAGRTAVGTSDSAMGGNYNFVWSDDGRNLTGAVMGSSISHSFVEADNITGGVYNGASMGAATDNNMHIWDNLTGGWYMTPNMKFTFTN